MNPESKNSHFWIIKLFKSNFLTVALSAINLELVGPFDVLSGDIQVDDTNLTETKKQAMLHWRYYFDVPEVQTCLKVSGHSQLHYGYFRFVLQLANICGFLMFSV